MPGSSLYRLLQVTTRTPAALNVSFFGAATNPVDNGSATEPATLTLTPPGSMLAGDLVVLFASNESGSVADGKTINNDGGQTWTTDDIADSYERAGVAAGHKIWWCTFNGTWSADPSVDFPALAGTRAVSLQMLVFRPSTTSKVWTLDQANAWASFSAPSTPFTVSITGRTPVNADSVTVARWLSDDDNTWDTLLGTGWNKAGLDAQYRNLGGSDISATYAYRLMDAAVATNDVSQNQATLGGDAGTTLLITWYAATPVSFLAAWARGSNMGAGFNV